MGGRLLSRADGFRYSSRLARFSGPFDTELGLAPGQYSVVAQTAEGFRATLQFEVEVGAEEPQTIQLTLR